MKRFSQIISIISILGLIVPSVSFAVAPVSGYRDTETSNGNTFSAATLDFSLSSGGDFSPNITPTQTSVRTVDIANDGILGFQYNLGIANISGSLCGYLNLEANLNGGASEYNGSLAGVNYSGTFGAPESWVFTTTLTSSDSSLENQTCSFDLVFNGSQIGGAGFSDTEAISNTITSGAWAVSCPNTETINNVRTGSSFDFTGKNVVIQNGGALQTTTSSITVTTDCNFTIENGGEIRANGTNGGTVNLIVGGNLSVAGNSIEATSISNSSTNNGGDINIDVDGDFTLTGTVDSYGQENAGDITITIDGAFTITSTGKLFSKSGDSSDTNTGGMISITTGDDFTVNGEVNSYGSENAGDITLVIGSDLAVPTGGKIYSKSGSTPDTNAGGDITANISGNFDLGGELNSFGSENAGQIKITTTGTTLISGNSIKAKSDDTNDANSGGLIRITSSDSLTVTGLIDAYGQERGGVIELKTNSIFTLSSTGQIKAESGTSSDTDRGGNISIIALGGNSSFAGEILAGGQEQGGNIAITVAGNATFTDDVKVNAGSSSDTNRGGKIVLTTPGLLTVSSIVQATGVDGNGAIQTNYCTKDFTGAAFNPAPTEITNCSSVVLNEFVPNPSSNDDAAMTGGEWVELYNYGAISIDVSGWVLYDNNDTHALPITNSNTNTGGTTVVAGGFLVVYRNGDSDFDLDNSGGDSVRLFDGVIGSGGTLRDTRVYTSNPADGKSYARVPDGGVWYDPVPSPGESNSVTFDYFSDFLNVEAEENQEEGIIDKINETLDEIVSGIVEEIMPEETPATEEQLIEEPPAEELIVPETPILEETVIEEPAVEELPIIENTPVDNGEQIIMPSDNNSDSENNSGNDSQAENSDGGSAETVVLTDNITTE